MKPPHGQIRELATPACRSFLAENCIGRLGCYSNGHPYVVPITYVFADGAIFAHSREGEKLKAMRKHPKVCFEVDECHGLNEWKSVIAFGSFEELHGDAAASAMRRLIQQILKYRPDRSVSTLEVDITALLETAVIFQIKIEKMSGRYEHI